MVKADDKVCFEGNEKEKYTNFEELRKRVEILQECLDEHALILRQNNLVKKQEIEAPYFDEDQMYRELEEETKEVKPNSSQA